MRIGPTIAVSGSATLFRVACGAGGDDGSAESDGARNTTLTTSIPADPGDLHPHMTTLAAARGVAAYMYDELVYFSMEGEQLPWLAESWEVEPDTVADTIREGVTCSDGSLLTASDVAANFEFIVDPDNGSPELTEAVPDDHYTFQRRDEFSWGRGEISAADEGTVENLILRVIENESTAVNLFLSGELDAVTATGADRQRLEEEYEQVVARGTVGELFFNQVDGRPGADPEVRAALAQALDCSERTAVITGGFGERSRAVAAIDPVANETIPTFLQGVTLDRGSDGIVAPTIRVAP